MTIYRAPVEDVEFLLNELLQIGDYADVPGFADVTPDIVRAILDEVARFTENELRPLNQSGDRQGCRFDEGHVRTPDGFREAYRLMVENGWTGLTADPDYGGQGLPRVFGSIYNEFSTSANMAFSMYPGLSAGAYEAISHHGTGDQKRLYLPKLASGEWSGTMNLTEPHCGTDLGLLRTRATPHEDGSYRITGTKIFISAGEHDMTGNIIHLVLARIEGAPEGTGGISLFIVPKIRVNPDGSLGDANGVSCGAIEKKMGIHGNATCVMNYENARGWLLGKENKGMRAMFTFMNEARLAVGIQGLALSEVAGQNAADYARERRQGRSLAGPAEPEQSADPIIVHPDVRRMLMDIRAFNEGARALGLWTALRASLAKAHPDAKIRERSADHMALLTPVIKGYFTDRGFANAVSAQQVFGGAGYITETGMEQFVRDARIAMIYEGTNGIQALDLVGRKLPAHGGRALRGFFGEITGFLEENRKNTDLAPWMDGLRTAGNNLEKATGWLMQNAMTRPDNAGAAATDYLHLMGITALALMWARMAKIAQDRLANGTGNPALYNRKRVLGRYFMERVVPDTAAHLARITAGAGTMMELPADDF